MNLDIAQLLIRFVFMLSVATFFVNCDNDNDAREAAKEAALKGNNEKKASPAPAPDSKVPIRPATIGDLPISASSLRSSKGVEACIAVTARQFNKIVSMQYTMKWDPAVLKFKAVKNFGLPGMAAANFGARAVDKGILAYSWFDNNVRGISQSDGTKLYDVCFEVIGDAGSQSLFEFADAPVVIEISNSDSQFLGLQAVNGKVEVR